MSYTILSRVLGLFLLVTAALKLYGVTLDPAGRIGLFSGPEWQVGILEMEVLLALWLLSGSNPIGAWLTSLLAFSSFAIASAYMGWVGQASCGCFGAVKVNPWYTFTLDIVIIAALALRRPDLRELREQPRTRILSTLLPLVYGAVGVALFLVLLTGAAYASFGSTQAAIAHLRGELVSVSPSLIDMGRCGAGATSKAMVEVRNWTNQPVRVFGGTSDCSCVVIDDLPVTITPGEGRHITVKIRPPEGQGAFNRKAFLLTDHDSARRIVFRLAGQIVRSNFDANGTRASSGD